MKRRWYASLFLAALVGLSGQRADAMRTPLADVRASITQPLQLTAATAAADLPADVPNQVRDASTWIVESIIPLGTTADGQPLALISLLVPNSSLDELAPASTRAGPYAAPKTHTRVFCIVQPPLGLEIINSVLGAQVNSAGVPMVLVQQKEYLAWKPSHFWKGRQKGGTILGDPEWVEASKSHLNSYFVHKYDGWHEKLDDYSIMREIVKEPLFQNLEQNSYQMYALLASEAAYVSGVGLGFKAGLITWKSLALGGVIGEGSYIGVQKLHGKPLTPGGTIGSFGGGSLGGMLGAFYYAITSQGLDIQFGHQKDGFHRLEFALDIGVAYGVLKIISSVTKNLPLYLRGKVFDVSRSWFNRHGAFPGRQGATRRAHARWMRDVGDKVLYGTYDYVSRAFPGVSSWISEEVDARTGLDRLE